MKKGEEMVYPTGCQSHIEPTGGLTKREYFAATAMQGLLASGSQTRLSHSSFEDIAKMAVHQADAILTELEKATA